MIIMASVETTQYQVWCVNICSYIAHYPKMIFMFVCFAFIKMKNEVLYFYLDLYDDEARSSITVKQCHQAKTICIVPPTYHPKLFWCLNISNSLELVYILYILQSLDSRREDHLHIMFILVWCVCV